jgi:hypothetical protein
MEELEAQPKVRKVETEELLFSIQLAQLEVEPEEA